MNDNSHSQLEATLANIATSLAMIAEALARTNGPRDTPQLGPDFAHIAGQSVRRDGNTY